MDRQTSHSLPTLRARAASPQRAVPSGYPGAAPRVLGSFLGSTVGKKVAMAATGFVLFGYVVGHMSGNLLVFAGPEALNKYGAFLHEVGHGLGIWLARAGLLASVVIHVWAAASLTIESRAARPVAYRVWTPRESSYASRTMRWSGVIVGLFVVYHLLHFTTGTVHGSFVPGDVYHNVIAGFRVWPVSAFYILAMLALGLHLFHGVWSMLQTLGLSHPRYDRLRVLAAGLFTAAVVVGNISIPVAVLAGGVR